MADLDQEAADKQSRRIAQAIFWVILLVMLAIAAFATWASIAKTVISGVPAIFMPVVAVVMWVGIIGLVIKAYRGNEQRKRDMNEE